MLATLAAMLCFAATALGAGRVYWANGLGDKISYVSLDGSGGGDVDTGTATVSDPLGIAIDPAAGRVYWVNSTGSVAYANLDGSGGGDLDTGTATMGLAVGLGIDPAAGRLYWTSAFSNTISYANIDGSGGADLETGQATVDVPTGIAVDPAAGRVYWGSLSNGISFAKVDGTGGGNLFLGAATAAFPLGLTIDPAAGRLYWVNSGESKLSYVNLDGTGGGDVPSNASNVVGLAIDPVARRIYWGSEEAIGYQSLDGSGGGELDTSGVTAGSRAFPVLLEPPAPVAPPAIGGGETAGTTLTCGGASWAADLSQASYFRAPHSFSYGWSLDGVPIAGADGSSIQATGPGSYRCTVSASNAAGTTAQTSAAHLVSAAPTAAPATPPGAARANGRATVRKGRALLRLRCPGPGACQGTLKLLYAERARGRTGGGAKSSGRRPTRTRRVVLGGSSFAVAAGRTATVPVKLSRRARALLREAGRRGLKADLRGSGVRQRTVKLKPAKAPRRR